MIELQQINGSKEELYNYEFKERFLQLQYPKENTRRVKRTHLKHAADLEYDLNKDLYDFTFEEFEELLYKIGAKTVRSLQSILPTLRRYIQFAIEQGVKKSKDNSLENFGSTEVISKYLNKLNLFSKETITNILSSSENPQDGVIVALIFEGLSIKKKFQELVNLQIKDIDFDEGIITLPNRKITISEDTKKMIHLAIKSTEYVSVKGDERKYALPASKYILKSPRGNDYIPTDIIYQRIVRMSNYFDLKTLNATTISYSGQINYAAALLKSGKNIESVITSILDRFHINENVNSRNKLRIMINEHLGDLLKTDTNEGSIVDLRIIKQDIDAERAEEEEYYEDGDSQNFYGIRYERDPKNRQRAIEIHGLSCKICNFIFEEVYGEYGKDFIEVHHINPLSLTKKVTINPAKDLIPVCSNCHRIIHRKKNEILSVEQVRQMIESR